MRRALRVSVVALSALTLAGCENSATYQMLSDPGTNPLGWGAMILGLPVILLSDGLTLGHGADPSNLSSSSNTGVNTGVNTGGYVPPPSYVHTGSGRTTNEMVCNAGRC